MRYLTQEQAIRIVKERSHLQWYEGDALMDTIICEWLELNRFQAVQFADGTLGFNMTKVQIDLMKSEWEQRSAT